MLRLPAWKMRKKERKSSVSLIISIRFPRRRKFDCDRDPASHFLLNMDMERDKDVLAAYSWTLYERPILMRESFG